MLEDGDFRLTEGSAILKYLADKYDLPVYPKDLKQRAKVNEIIDWLNTQFYRDFGYGLIYPQLFPHHKRRSDEAHAGAIAWGQQAQRIGCRFSTTTGSARKTNISAATNSPLPTISAPPWYRSGI